MYFYRHFYPVDCLRKEHPLVLRVCKLKTNPK
jgi:hypothetical protein